MNVAVLLLAVLSIWDYPVRYPVHHRLARQFAAASREGDTATMEETCRKGVALLPDDPTWHYNLACSLAYFPKREDDAFEELERAIDLGFRDVEQIERDADLKRLAADPRYRETLEYARFMKSRAILSGPLATVDATGIFGKPITLGEQNLGWDFDVGCFVARMKLAQAGPGGNVGDLYMNRDGRHSMLNVGGYPGLTSVTFDSVGTNRNMHLAVPNVLFPYPAFGNCSQAIGSNLQPVYWRSLPRLLMTAETLQLAKMAKLYLSNQIWVFPANEDIAPVGTNGDVFASIAPYWITTAGRSWSDLPYLRAALEVSRTLKSAVKKEIVRRGLLAPTIQTLVRKSLRGVTNEVAYLGPKAHPTAFPAGMIEFARLKASAAALAADQVPPLAKIEVEADGIGRVGDLSELTYGTAFAWAFVLRTDEETRAFTITATGAAEYAFAQTHGAGVDVRIERTGPGVAKVTVGRRGLSPTNRVDIMVCGRNPGTDWGAPSYVSFARMDAKAPYSDPVLTAKEVP